MALRTRNGPRVLVGAALTAALLASLILCTPSAAAADEDAAAASTADAGGSQLVVNGGFERPTIDEPWVAYFPNGAEMPGWTVVSGSVDLVGTDWPAARGGQSLGLNGFGPGAIRQTIATEPGVAYRLSFQLGGDPNGRVKDSRLRIRWGGDWVASLGVHVNGDPGWHRVAVDLVASRSVTPLVFRGVTETRAGPALDAVSVRALC